MARRSIWNGAISFGMVVIPVKLYTATESKDIAFVTLHKTCNNRIRQKRYCSFHESEVEMVETVKGYEYAKEQYVVMDQADFDGLPRCEHPHHRDCQVRRSGRYRPGLLRAELCAGTGPGSPETLLFAQAGPGRTRPGLLSPRYRFARKSTSPASDPMDKGSCWIRCFTLTKSAGCWSSASPKSLRWSPTRK